MPIVFLLYEKIGLTFSCYVAVPIVAPIALCGFYSYNGMGFREVFTRYMRSIFRNKTLVFKSSGYRKMVSEINAREEAERKAAVRKMERTAYDVEEIKIEDLEPAPEMMELLEKEKRGEITKEEIRDIFYRRGYTMKV